MPLVLRKQDERYKVWDHRTPELTQSITILEPGCETTGHRHPWPESYVFIVGTGRLRVGHTWSPIRALSAYSIPANRFHKVMNEGHTIMAFCCAWQNDSEKGLTNTH